jgi:hypothetical protein
VTADGGGRRRGRRFRDRRRNRNDVGITGTFDITGSSGNGVQLRV